MQTSDLLTTTDVCITLGLTPARVQRLVKEGHLEIVGETSLRHGDIHLFHRNQIEDLAPRLPRILRRWEEAENLKRGAGNAALMRARRQRAAPRIAKSKESFINFLASLPTRQADLLKSCYYLYHLNHYAKSGGSYLYDYKENVMRIITRHFDLDDGLEVSLVEGRHRVDLCPSCKDRARRQGSTYVDYARQSGGCKTCRRDTRYYSLFEFSIHCGDYRFCFHTPYQVARKWFPRDFHVPTKDNARQHEGGFAFGRPISEAEAKAVSLDETLDELSAFIEEYDHLPTTPRAETR